VELQTLAYLAQLGHVLVGERTLAAAANEIAPDARDRLGLNPNSTRELTQVYGAYLWAMLALLAGLVVMLMSRIDRAGRMP